MKEWKKGCRTVCGLVLCVLLFAGCTNTQKFDGSRTGNDKQFIMQYSVLNTTDSQDLVLEAGDVIDVKIAIEKGSLSIVVKKEGNDPIYQGNNISTPNDFVLKVEEAGTYQVSVTGKHAKGNVSFKVEGA